VCGKAPTVPASVAPATPGVVELTAPVVVPATFLAAPPLTVPFTPVLVRGLPVVRLLPRGLPVLRLLLPEPVVPVVVGRVAAASVPFEWDCELFPRAWAVLAREWEVLV